MKFFVTFIFLLVFGLLTNAQSQNLKSFIPKGYGLLDSASGDLNKDGIKDLILILKNNLEESFPDTTRPLLILHGTKTKGYVLVAKNAHVVLCKNCGGIYGDPYERVVVKNNFFSVEHYGGSNWRWTRIITFKYDMITRQYVLHRDAGISFHTSNPDKTINMTTGDKNFDKLPFVKFTNQE